jgi:hypothetical protein
MSQTTTPTPSAGATNDDEFWAKQTEALLEHLSLRDLEKEVRKYQPFVGTGLSSEDIARRALDIAINEEVEEIEISSPFYGADLPYGGWAHVADLQRDYDALTGKDRSDAAIVRRNEIIKESRAKHEHDEARMQLAAEALAAKREALVAQAYDDIWMGTLNPDLSISNFELAQIQEFRNRWNVVEISDPLGPGDITDAQMLTEYAELRGLISRDSTRLMGHELSH